MTEVSSIASDIQRAFPLDGSPTDEGPKLGCLRELHQHYIQFFASPEGSLTLGEWTATDRIVQIEDAWNRYEETRAEPAMVSLPTSGAEFAEWFAEISDINEYHDICDYLRNDASLLDIALMVLAEGKVEGYFDDLMALAQVGATGVTKMTIANNYWDEMGNGDYDAVHTTMLQHTADWMLGYARKKDVDFGIIEFSEAYSNACVLLMYCLRRRYLLRGLAGLGLLETTAPARFAATVDGLRRLGVPDGVFRYETVHAVVDQHHSREWVDGVFTATIDRNPETIKELALGTLIRGNIAAEFFHKVHRDLFGLG